MTHEDFVKLVEEIQEDQRRTLTHKNASYAPGDDKLANFKKSGRSLNKKPEEALWFFTQKHLTRIQDMVYGDCEYSPEALREIGGDVRNYLILLEALMMEKNNLKP